MKLVKRDTFYTQEDEELERYNGLPFRILGWTEDVGWYEDGEDCGIELHAIEIGGRVAWAFEDEIYTYEGAT